MSETLMCLCHAEMSYGQSHADWCPLHIDPKDELIAALRRELEEAKIRYLGNEATYGRCISYSQRRRVETERQLAASQSRLADVEQANRMARDLLEQSQARVKVLSRALRDYVEWCGPNHEPECSGDDCCDCAAKPIHAAVNAALSAEADPADLSEWLT